MTPSKNDLLFVIVREPVIRHGEKEAHTPGKVYASGLFFCFSCEDEDRFLEKGGVKIKGKTAIPRGVYELVLSFSHRFQKVLPEVLCVKDYSGVRCHGGNEAEDSEGCPLLGQVRTSTGVAKCADTVQRMIKMIESATDQGRRVFLEVK